MLDERLKTLLHYLKGFNTLIDIGTDHAYLPIQAIKKDIVTKAYAVDNKQGPLNVAKKNIQANHLESHITTLLSSGIEVLPDDADVLVMAGLGGDAIYEALKKGPYKNLKRLILQANNHPERVRQLTHHNNWKIVDESVVAFKTYDYPIIVLDLGSQTLTEKERLFGPVLLEKRPPSFIDMLKKECDYLHNLMTKIPDVKAKEPLLKRIKAIEEVLYERCHD